MSSSTSPKPSDDTTASSKSEQEAPASGTAGDADSTDSGEARAANDEVKDRTDADEAGSEADAASKSSVVETSKDEIGGPPAREQGAQGGEDEAKAEGSAEPEKSSVAEDAPDTDEQNLPDAQDAAQNPDDDEDDDEEETLDLRALFASSEPEFANPTETFEMARDAKPEARETPASTAPQDEGETELPFDLPVEGMLNAPGTSGDSGLVSRSGGFGGDADRREDTANAFGGDPNDPLADAVQSALRSVYGDEDKQDKGETASQRLEPSDAGPILQWAGSGMRDQTDNDATHAEDDETVAEPDPQDTAAIDAETTEAVLSYLYEHVGNEESGKPAFLNEARAVQDELGADHGSDHAGRRDWGAETQTPEPFILPSNAAEYEVGEPAMAAPPASDQQPTTAQTPYATQAEAFHAPIDVGTAESEASGKLLGAAGLGLIGGIAAAGVAAVFVFNSFVTQQDTAGTRQPTAAAVSDANASGAGADGGTAGTQTAETAPEPSTTPEATTGVTEPSGSSETTPESAASESTQTATVTPELNPPGDAGAETDAETAMRAEAVSGAANAAIPLALSLPKSDGDRFVRITGLPENVKLSAGVDTGNGSWLLSAGRAEQLTLTAPDRFTGMFTLNAQLLGSDARTPLSEPVSFEVEVAGAAVAQAGETRTAAVDSQPSPGLADEARSPLDQAERLLRAGDVETAREILRTQTGDNNAEAALALGRSYDPRTFTGLTSANASPDATEAFRWYQKAAELGDPNGNSQISELKAWLLR